MAVLPKASLSTYPMTVEEFLSRDLGSGAWQLADGEPQMMTPPSPLHGRLQAEVARVIAEHLLRENSPCALVVTPGVQPQVRADMNLRIPDLAVTCSDPDIEGEWLTHPLLLAEILSPSNRAETWANVWTYTSIPSVQEILVLGTGGIWADVIRRQPDGTWPREPLRVTAGGLALDSIGLHTPIESLYRTTRLRRPAA